jgi:hypothetical protein
LLFGGGLSLAAAIQGNGVGELLASYAMGLAGVPYVVILLAVVTGVVFLTELTSNTATTATLVQLPDLGRPEETTFEGRVARETRDPTHRRSHARQRSAAGLAVTM